MKKATKDLKIPFRAILLIIGMMLMLAPESEAQIFKKIGKKIEKSVERRVERKIDQGVEKSLDKVEDGVDKSVKDATTEKPKDRKKKDQEEAPEMTIAEIDDSSYSTEAAKKAKAHDGLVLVSGNCYDFAWFRKGAELQYQIESPGEKENYVSSMKIKDVKNEGSKTIAEVISSDNEGNSVEMNFICTGNQLYFDLSGMMKAQLEKHGQSGANMDVSFDGGLMTIPKNIYPGQQLEDAVFTMTMTSSGVNIAISSYLKDRKVVGRESVITPAGTFNCVKITGVRTVKMNMMGKARVMGKPVIEHMYFAPSIGMIKSVSESQKGKVEYRQTLTKYSW